MTSTYENIPVFRSGSNFGADGIQSLVGKAKVTTDDETGKTTITIETTSDSLPTFLSIGELVALELSAFMRSVDKDLAAEYWSKQQR